jgi:thymidylate kinase
VTIVTFSGIDGAGKSTQITGFESWLHRSGLRTMIVTFWEDVAVLARFRERISRSVFRGEQGIGSPDKPVNRRDKNISSWPVTVARYFLYCADSIKLAVTVHRLKKAKTDFVIFDRYIYDELANLPLRRGPARTFAWLLMKLIPKPDIAYIIDADPVAARARKPEYPLEFLRRNREAYVTLANLDRDIKLVAPSSIKAVESKIRQEMLRAMWTGGNTSYAHGQ